MAHPIHCEIRSSDPDATRDFFGKLFGWTYTAAGFPGYTFVETGDTTDVYRRSAPYRPERPGAVLHRRQQRRRRADQAEQLGATIVQASTEAPGVTFGVFADPLGHQIGVAAQG